MFSLRVPVSLHKGLCVFQVGGRFPGVVVVFVFLPGDQIRHFAFVVGTMILDSFHLVFSEFVFNDRNGRRWGGDTSGELFRTRD